MVIALLYHFSIVLFLQPPCCVLTRCGSAYNNVMAEYVLGYILTKERFIIQVSAEQQKSSWDRCGITFLPQNNDSEENSLSNIPVHVGKVKVLRTSVFLLNLQCFLPFESQIKLYGLANQKLCFTKCF